MSDVFAADDFGKFDLKNITSMGSTSFYGVSINNNHRESRRQQVRSNASLIQIVIVISFIVVADRPGRKTNSLVNKANINKDRPIRADEATTVGTRPLIKKPQPQPAQVRTQTGAVPATLDVWGLH